MSYPQTRKGGDSRRRKLLLLMAATISAPKPEVMGASCTTTSLPVLLTDSSTKQQANALGRRDSEDQHVTEVSISFKDVLHILAGT